MLQIAFQAMCQYLKVPLLSRNEGFAFPVVGNLSIFWNVLLKMGKKSAFRS